MDKYHTEVENAQKYILLNPTTIVKEIIYSEEANEKHSEENDAINKENVPDVYSFYETAQECDSHMFNTTINERAKPINCYGQLFSNSHMPVAFFVSLLLRTFGNNY